MSRKVQWLMNDVDGRDNYSHLLVWAEEDYENIS
jgi:hypothetical protein